MSERVCEVVEEVLGHLRSGVSVSLVGLPGSGRSRTANQVAQQLAKQGAEVVRLDGIEALQQRPLAALAAAGIEA
ncbi:MAG: adenylyl-sulfate kinase, partial [Propionibacteriaceae bacterium]|nr:adenylyl-sulfate kinase [Propionibacteriaceae bacterium]